jgi:hypothetical protein
VTGIEENGSGKQAGILKCYPNPADDNVVILPLIPTGETGLLKIFDVFGRTVFDQEMSSEGEILIRTNSFHQGIYFPVLECANHRMTGKFIISR